MSFSEYVLNHNVRSKSNTTGAKYGAGTATLLLHLRLSPLVYLSKCGPYC